MTPANGSPVPYPPLWRSWIAPFVQNGAVLVIIYFMRASFADKLAGAPTEALARAIKIAGSSLAVVAFVGGTVACRRARRRTALKVSAPAPNPARELLVTGWSLFGAGLFIANISWLLLGNVRYAGVIALLGILGLCYHHPFGRTGDA